MAALLQQTSNDIQEVTGSSQAMQQMPSNIAKETVNNLMNRSDMSSFIYLDNMAKSLKGREKFGYRWQEKFMDQIDKLE